jgi:uncharacterized protein (TIGR02266 family)
MQPETGVQHESQHPQSASNRRVFDRVICKVDVTLESESTFYNGFTENISLGGLFIATYDTRPLGQKVSLHFTIPGKDEPIEVEGEIRWVREYNDMTPDIIPGMGIQFVDLEESDRMDIEAFVSVKEPLFYDD